MMKLVVLDKGQSVVTSSFNQLMQDLLCLQGGTSVVGDLASILSIEKAGAKASNFVQVTTT